MLSSLLCGRDPGAFTGPESQHLPAAQSLGIQKCPGCLTDVLHTVSRDQTHQGGTGATDIGSIRLLFVKEIKDLLRTGDQLQPVGLVQPVLCGNAQVFPVSYTLLIACSIPMNT